MPKKAKLSFIENFGLAGVAAVVSKTVAAPIERIKMVVQNQDEMLKRGTLKEGFSNPFACGAWIMKNEGFLAFWKSNFTNCLRYFPTQALNFSFKGKIKQVPALAKNKADSGITKLFKNIAAGGIAGGGSLICVYSLDYARTRLANDMKQTSKEGGKEAGEREFTGLVDVYAKTFKADGLSGLYRGFNISFVGIFVYRGLYFGLYDTIMPLLPSDVSYAIRFLVGYTVTVLAGLVSYPIDTIRRRMMMTSGGGTHYSGSLDCAKQIMAQEGWQSYFKGAGANIMRGIAGAMVISGFDVVKRAYVKQVYGPEYDI
jgi:solute carrier family 25 (adenine nucleotide translocator) protein 4/5/6/31